MLLKIDCQNTTILPFLSIVKNNMLLIQIIVPLILIISGIISFTHILIKKKKKKELKKILNKFLAAAIVFIIPLFKDAVHQNPTGAYLSAATIFKSLAGKSPTSTSYTGGISKNDAKKVFNIVAHN